MPQNQLRIRQPQTPKAQPQARAQKYNVQYGQNGELFHNGSQFGNYYTSNALDVGVESFLENWAKMNKIELQPTMEWTEQNRTPLRTEDPEADVSEQNVLQTFGVSEQARNSEKPGANIDLAAEGNILPLTSYTANQGFTQPINQNVDTQQYGKGFSPENLNPFFRK